MKTFELVLGGHPDKVCDIIAENIKDVVKGKSAVEVVWFNKKIIVGGEVGSLVEEQRIRQIVKDTLLSLDYQEEVVLENYLQLQSQEIADVVRDFGAGDNGIFFGGYHWRWTEIIRRLKEIAKLLTDKAKDYYYRTDGKFIAKFNEKGELVKFTLNIASHTKQDKFDRIYFMEYLDSVLKVAFTGVYLLEINPKGIWYKCGGFADSGLTGRKLACDNSCGLFRQGGGAFFGKDISKADYSVPLYLSYRAKSYCVENALNEVELMAHTIIGDEYVDIYTSKGLFVEKVKYSDVMEFAKDNKMEWVGL